MTDYCMHVLYPEMGGLYPSPAEYCPAEAVPGTAYCEDHQEDEE